MYADIITIGDEILLGQVVDSNSAYIATSLNTVGIRVRMIHSVSDRERDIINTLDNSVQNSDLVILTGGLGPTDDDITKKALAAYFDSKLVIHQESLDHIRKIFSIMTIEMTKRNIRQAEIPEISEALPNSQGCAPGMLFRKNGKIIISLPGVPVEMKTLMQEQVLPLLFREYALLPGLHKTILTVGLGESVLADKLNSWEKELGNEMKLAYLPGQGILRLRLSVTDPQKKGAGDLLERKVNELTGLIGEYHIYGFDSDLLPAVVGRLLEKNNLTLSVAESCTGGNIARLITGIPGASAYFKGSVTAYANDIKTNILRVSEQDIRLHGAVSKQVVEQMATGIKDRFGSHYSIATSGIAGPEGGSAEKPVGTTWIAIASPDKVISRKFLLGNRRDRNIVRASLYALNMLRNTLISDQQNIK
ncbi:MAG: competence/damage-inducible protein A [Bacteroidales bacterium]